jgi:hypothetical protein
MEPKTLTMAVRVALEFVVGDPMIAEYVGVAETNVEDVAVNKRGVDDTDADEIGVIV